MLLLWESNRFQQIVVDWGDVDFFLSAFKWKEVPLGSTLARHDGGWVLYVIYITSTLHYLYTEVPEIRYK